MNQTASTPVDLSNPAASALAPAFAPARMHQAPLTARAVLRMLERLSHGLLDVVLPDDTALRLGNEQPGCPRAQLHVRSWEVFALVLRSGDIGFAEAFIAGHWTTPDLPALLRLMLANREQLEQAIYGRWWGSLVHRLRHLLNRNSLAGSRRNIHAHYDLGNTFYSCWLDSGMNYSSALFDGDAGRSLADAQQAKLARTLAAARVGTGDRVLEIGCGWGGLAQLAAERGASVTGLTLSTEQLAWAQRRVSAAGVSRQCDLRLQDYRLVDDQPFDAVVSIEMFEAVGRTWWPTYFETVARCLKPGGRACVQSITIADELFDRYAKSSDFIQQYIFPGGMLPSPSQFRAGAEKAGLVVEDSFAFGADYAETLRRWRVAFHAHEAEVRHLGFDPQFMRTWDFYLAYCEAAFDAGSTDVYQFTLYRP
jgi:cyclopropane-fatty-acyl-phospholipid synthase